MGLTAVLLAGAANAQPADPKVAARIDKILAKTPMIDGHNDIPWSARQ
ncbi:MAG: membrane dipeptidase, partial [Phenylobacterium zucineum]